MIQTSIIFAPERKTSSVHPTELLCRMQADEDRELDIGIMIIPGLIVLGMLGALGWIMVGLQILAPFAALGFLLWNRASPGSERDTWHGR
jgi:hypothetical protein